MSERGWEMGEGGEGAKGSAARRRGGVRTWEKGGSNASKRVRRGSRRGTTGCGGMEREREERLRCCVGLTSSRIFWYDALSALSSSKVRPFGFGLCAGGASPVAAPAEKQRVCPPSAVLTGPCRAAREEQQE